jgi:hypothetical protein
VFSFLILKRLQHNILKQSQKLLHQALFAESNNYKILGQEKFYSFTRFFLRNKKTRIIFLTIILTTNSASTYFVNNISVVQIVSKKIVFDSFGVFIVQQ